jgi:hypothetical protein
MMRLLYECLLMAHPPSFRQRFKPEMLCIFDEATASKSDAALALFLDAFVSLFRQWLLRTGSWRLLAALAGASIQVMIGGLIWTALGRAGSVANASTFEVAALDRLVPIIFGVSCGIVLMVATASLWMHSFVQRRTQSSRTGR